MYITFKFKRNAQRLCFGVKLAMTLFLLTNNFCGEMFVPIFNILPKKKFGTTCFNNYSDWCISRQLWWGHRVPAYECSNGDEKYWIAARNQQEALLKAREKFPATSVDEIVIRQDEDVLDTWFSSALLPFSAFGWPEKVFENKKKIKSSSGNKH